MCRGPARVQGADVVHTLTDLGLSDYRPRFPQSFVWCPRTGLPPSAYSAGSQTVSEMTARGLVELRAGSDARQRLVHLTRKAQRLRPVIDAEWAATTAAVRELSTELSAPLDTIAHELAEALQHRSFRDRIAGYLDGRDRG